MTVPVQTIFNAYTANGVTTVFPYDFKISAAEDLQVSVAGVVVTTGFTVSGVGLVGGGDVTFSVAPLDTLKVLIELYPILKRTTDYQQFGDWFALNANNDFDRLVLMMQRAFRDIEQSLHLEVDSTASALLPTPVANMALFWNSTGDAIEYRDLSSVVAVGANDVHAAASKATPVGADELLLIDSASGWTLVKLTLTNLAAWISSAVNALSASRTDSGEVTITGHATTADIFGAAANSILFDDAGGAITVTAIPAASKAGMTRDVRYNGATKYTTSANLIIEGIPSGTTITLASGATAQFRAITTTQFKMTYSLSGTFTATGTGFTVNPTTTAKYTVIDGNVSLSMPAGAMTGTSNSTAFTVTGLPACIQPSSSFFSQVLSGYNNSVAVFNITANVIGSVMTLAINNDANGWTAAGSKQLNCSQFYWRIVS